jgi:hypothetical protein
MSLYPNLKSHEKNCGKLKLELAQFAELEAFLNRSDLEPAQNH